jgi:predicted phage terminase large subunit-like protein
LVALTSPLEVARANWIAAAREEQLTPEGEWNVWLLLAGRGYGKTRTAAEDIAWYGLAHPKSRIAIVAETFGDGRDVCVEGTSGLISVLPLEAIANWNRSLGELVLTNGTRYKIFSGDKPDQLRGPQHHRAWCDELAKFQYARETWDQLLFGLRLGTRPQAIVTTTPRPIDVLRGLLEREGEDVVVTRGSTFDNAPNLSAAALAQLRDRYQGTRLGRQELAGELLDDVPGALWTRDLIDAERIKEAPDLARVVVAIDPAMTSGEEADETGIVVAGKGVDGRGYVLSDATCRLSPDGWARRAVEAYDTYKADRIVAEVNNGGEMVEYTLRTVTGRGSRIPYKKLHASRGKRVRAEPIAALYEQGRVSHVGAFPELEDQMCTFVPDEVSFSPDRVDALVWALTELMLTERKAKVHVFDSWSA